MDDERRIGEVRYFRPILLTVWNAVFAAHDLHHGQAQLLRSAGALLRALLGAIAWCATLFALGVILYTQSGLSMGEVLLSLVVVAPVNFVGLWLLYEQGVVPVYRRKLGLVPTLVPTLIVGEEEERQRIRRVLEKRPSTYTYVGG